MIVTESEVWEMVNAAKCASCGVLHHLTDSEAATIHADVGMQEEWENLIYDTLGDRCCDDPYLIPVINSTKPLFGADVDDDYKMPAGPANPFRPASDVDMWVYEVDDDFFSALGISR